SAANRDDGLARVAATRASSGDIKRALKLAAGLHGPRRDEALTAIGRAQAEAGDAEGALETSALAEGDGPARPQILAVVAATRARAGDRDGAAALTTRIRDALPPVGIERSLGLTALAAAQAAAGRHEAARETLGRVDGAWRARGLAALAAAQARLGDVEQTRE